MPRVLLQLGRDGFASRRRSEGRIECSLFESFLRFLGGGGFKSKSNKYSMHRVWLLAQPSQVLGIDLNGLAPAQSHPGPPIEFISNGIELLLGVATQIGALWEVLAQ